MTHLSLFTGIGGLDLAAEWAGIETIGQCEWADYPTKVLEKHWPKVPRWKDIRTLTGESFYERTGKRTVDIISGGFPCQPFSVAGKQRGKEDDRYLWPEMVRVIKELRPTWVVGENVTGIIRMALTDILSELEGCGYRTRVFHIPASGVGARHHRYRVAIVAYAKSRIERRLSIGEEPEKSGFGICGENVANTESEQNRWKEQRGIQTYVGTSCKDVQHTNGAGCKEQHTTAESDKEGFIGRGCDAASVFSDSNNGGWYVRRNREFSTVEETERTRRNIRGGTQEYEPGEWRAVESVLGGMVDGIPIGVDGDLDLLINYYWDEEPDIPRIEKGIKNRVDRLKCLGNAVVPQQFYLIFKAINEIERGAEEEDEQVDK